MDTKPIPEDDDMKPKLLDLNSKAQHVGVRKKPEINLPN